MVRIKSKWNLIAKISCHLTVHYNTWINWWLPRLGFIGFIYVLGLFWIQCYLHDVSLLVSVIFLPFCRHLFWLWSRQGGLGHGNLPVILSNTLTIIYSFDFRENEQEVNSFLKSKDSLLINSIIASRATQMSQVNCTQYYPHHHHTSQILPSIITYLFILKGILIFCKILPLWSISFWIFMV